MATNAMELALAKECDRLREALMKMFEQDASMNWRYSRVECASIAAKAVEQ